MLDDVSPISTQPKKGKMKKTSRYYKKKHARFQFFKENNNVFIIPTLRIYYDKFYNNKFDRLLLEVSWLNYTFAIKFI